MDFPIEKWWFSIVMLVYQRVNILCENLNPFVSCRRLEISRWWIPSPRRRSSPLGIIPFLWLKIEKNHWNRQPVIYIYICDIYMWYIYIVKNHICIHWPNISTKPTGYQINHDTSLDYITPSRWYLVAPEKVVSKLGDPARNRSWYRRIYHHHFQPTIGW